MHLHYISQSSYYIDSEDTTYVKRKTSAYFMHLKIYLNQPARSDLCLSTIK